MPLTSRKSIWSFFKVTLPLWLHGSEQSMWKYSNSHLGQWTWHFSKGKYAPQAPIWKTSYVDFLASLIFSSVLKLNGIYQQRPFYQTTGYDAKPVPGNEIFSANLKQHSRYVGLQKENHAYKKKKECAYIPSHLFLYTHMTSNFAKAETISCAHHYCLHFKLCVFEPIFWLQHSRGKRIYL